MLRLRLLAAVSVILLVCLVAGAAHSGSKANQTPFEKDVRKLLEVTDAAATADQMMDGMLKQLRPMVPDVPERFWKEFRASVDSAELIELLVPIYVSKLKHEDVKAAVAFYQSKHGKAFIKAQPQILAESMAAGQKWGEGMAGKVVAKLKAEGYDVK